mmetsp:Transcript_62329/g.136174  ORF Transcript_62329/g.136174 Transcript_62329/m.136174 type:complete len:104 (-) Transcript_62329:577-888(-)
MYRNIAVASSRRAGGGAAAHLHSRAASKKVFPSLCRPCLVECGPPCASNNQPKKRANAERHRTLVAGSLKRPETSRSVGALGASSLRKAWRARTLVASSLKKA